jgi:hypothetical protein
MRHPTTLAEALNRLDAELPQQSKAELSGLAEDELVEAHLGLGTWIRNSFGLWEKDSPLLRELAGPLPLDPDDAAAGIIKAYWHRVSGR